MHETMAHGTRGALDDFDTLFSRLGHAVALCAAFRRFEPFLVKHDDASIIKAADRGVVSEWTAGAWFRRELAAAVPRTGRSRGSFIDDMRHMRSILALADRLDSFYDAEFQPCVVSPGFPVPRITGHMTPVELAPALEQWRAACRSATGNLDADHTTRA